MAQDKVFTQGVENKADANLLFQAILNTLLARTFDRLPRRRLVADNPLT
jgi:hypothetical protein